MVEQVGSVSGSQGGAQAAAPASSASPATATQVAASGPVTPASPSQAAIQPSNGSQAVSDAATPSPATDATLAPSGTTEIGNTLKTTALTAEKPQEKKDAAQGAEQAATEAEAKPAETPQAPVYGDWTYPEGITGEHFSAEGLESFNNTLGEYALKLSQPGADPTVALKELGQNILNQYIAGTKETVIATNQAWNDWFNNRQTEWQNAFINDKTYGGNRRETTINSAREFVRTHLGADKQNAFLKMLTETGAGDRVEMISALADLNEKFKEGGAVAATKPAAAVKKSPWEKAYGASA